jgi:hypothetical protein
MPKSLQLEDRILVAPNALIVSALLPHLLANDALLPFAATKSKSSTSAAALTPRIEGSTTITKLGTTTTLEHH